MPTSLKMTLAAVMLVCVASIGGIVYLLAADRATFAPAAPAAVRTGVEPAADTSVTGTTAVQR